MAGKYRSPRGFLRLPKRVDPQYVSQVLILEYRLPLGCLVHMTPVFEALKRCTPHMKVTVATCGLGLQVLRHSRFIDKLIETPDPTTHLAAAVLSLRRQLLLRRVTPHCVLTGASDQRTKIALLALFGSPGWRGGFTQHRHLYQKPLKYDPSLSLIGNNLRLARILGCMNNITQPRVFFSNADADAATRLLQSANPTGKSVAIVVTQNSGGQSTGWHTDRFADVIRHAAEVLDHTVIYVGTAADAPAIEAIRAAAGGIGTSIAGQTTVTELAAVLALSDLIVTLDTGTLHVGRAVGTPMVILGTSWQKPLEWMPLGVENVRILRGPDQETAPPNYRLDEITAIDVIAAMLDLAQAYPASLADRERRLKTSLSPIDHLPGR